MNTRITIDLAPGYDKILSITAVGHRFAGEYRVVTWGISVEDTTWLSVGEDGKVIEHGTDKPPEVEDGR